MSLLPKMKYSVVVGADDIAGATPWDAGNCPVGRAICRTIGHPHIWIAANLEPKVRVLPPEMEPFDDWTKKHYLAQPSGRGAAVWGSMWGPVLMILPEHVVDFLDDFEHGRPVVPGLTFDLEI